MWIRCSDVNGENHEEALGNSNSKAESAEDDETVENLNVVLARDVNWDCRTSTTFRFSTVSSSSALSALLLELPSASS
jgi:hypothetical protein